MFRLHLFWKSATLNWGKTVSPEQTLSERQNQRIGLRFWGFIICQHPRVCVPGHHGVPIGYVRSPLGCAFVQGDDHHLQEMKRRVDELRLR